LFLFISTLRGLSFIFSFLELSLHNCVVARLVGCESTGFKCKFSGISGGRDCSVVLSKISSSISIPQFGVGLRSSFLTAAYWRAHNIIDKITILGSNKDFSGQTSILLDWGCASLNSKLLNLSIKSSSNGSGNEEDEAHDSSADTEWKGKKWVLEFGG